MVFLLLKVLILCSITTMMQKIFFTQKLIPAILVLPVIHKGGIGAISAVTKYENGSYYKTIYTASAPHRELAMLKWEYDVSKINIPYFMTAGTLQVDAGNEKDSGIAPLWSLQENYEMLSNDIMKIYARRGNTDHGDMLANADGYMTAWFMYHLQEDEAAGKVFIGADAEILTNSNWQDVEKNR